MNKEESDSFDDLSNRLFAGMSGMTLMRATAINLACVAIMHDMRDVCMSDSGDPELDRTVEHFIGIFQHYPRLFVGALGAASERIMLTHGAVVVSVGVTERMKGPRRPPDVYH
jgi:hypothetical protein